MARRLPIQSKQMGTYALYILLFSIHGWIRSRDYSLAIEPISKKARIVRIPCGDGRALTKELLWFHLDGFCDQTLKFIKRRVYFSPRSCAVGVIDGIRRCIFLENEIG